ncbi:RNase adapter RapZ [Aestuariicoccus sp. MJ-SS9]|uniref:RNase adapter RapZ n=1 Tax=Aestuariicoccus sp. MJ-SS9 TaxID=3079855 RepID=UPI00290DF4B4|nr:RNase adapter RapZ [Aestuariicoccus sp. MJ-SS9]MDU8911720.1 RNase adapter RapZ [Aestuariicoccus sp. MJ-SS9]
MTPSPPGSHRVVLVTGPSGAGRATAINALEDLGYEAIDNMPLSLIPRLMEGPALARPVALGIDVRNREFSAGGLLDLHAQMNANIDRSSSLLYLDCAPEVLARRYSETRRRHPLAPDETPTEGIAREIALLEGVRIGADILIDTTELTPHDLRSEMQGWFGMETGQRMAISLHSFSYKRGLPQGLDMALDCRFLRNPHWVPELRGMTGLDAAVAEYVSDDDRFSGFIQKAIELTLFLLPAYVAEGKAHFSLGFGCTGGQHRSVFVTEKVASGLAAEGWQVSIKHRELERRRLPLTPGARTPTDGKAPG